MFFFFPLVSAVFDELAIRNAAIKLEDDYEECVRVLPYLQDGEVEIHVYFYSDSSGMPTGLKNAAEALVGQKGWKLKEKNLYNDAFNLLKVTPIKYSSGKPKRLEASQVDEIDEIINKHLHDFCKHRNVTAVHPSFKVTNSEETQEACIAVYVLGKGQIPLGESPIPPTIDSYPVDIVNGFFVRTNDPYKPTKAHKQQEFLQLGASIGVNGKESSGTLGAIVEDVESGTFYALSCNHVLNDDYEKEIIHPGLDVYLNHVRYNLNNYKGEIAKVLGPTVELPQHSELETMFRDLRAIREQRVASLVPPVSDYTTKLMNTCERKLERAFGQIPRPIARYLVGVTSNAIMTDGKEYFIDAAIAKLEEGEVQRVRAQRKVRIIDTPHYPSREYLQATAEVNNLFKSGSATGFTETNRLADEVHNKPMYIRVVGRGGGRGGGWEEGRGNWIDVGCIPCNKGREPTQSGRCEQCRPHGWFKRCLCIPDKGRKPFSGEGDSGAVIFEKHEDTLLSSGFAIIIGILDTQYHAFAIASSLQFALEELSRKVGEPCKLKLASEF